jgi:hypothetical protein
VNYHPDCLKVWCFVMAHNTSYAIG